jgi:FKBP-type peptidyl-prolyl cis-trans isomerase SlyD
MTIEKDRVVTIDYKLTDAEGELIDSSDGSEPLVYLHGNDNIIVGLENHLLGKKAGDSLACVIPAKEAYGERDESLIMTVGKAEFGAEAEIEIGMQFEAHGEQGNKIVTVKEIKGEDVVLDANHPLAGEELHFAVKVVDVREATAEELEQGHVHGGCDCGDCGDEEGGCGEGGCGCKG